MSDSRIRLSRILFYLGILALYCSVYARLLINNVIHGLPVEFTLDALPWTALTLFALSAFLQRRFVFYSCWTLVPLVLLAVLHAAALLLPLPVYRYQALQTLLHWASAIAILLAMYHVICNALNPRYFLAGLLGIGVVLCVYGLIQKYVIYDKTLAYVQSHPEEAPVSSKAEWDEYIHRIEQRQPSSTFVHPNDFGGFIAMLCPLLLAMILRERMRLRRAINIAALCLFLFTLYAANSKGGIMAVLFCCGGVMCLALTGKKSLVIQPILSALLVGLAVTVLVFVHAFPIDAFDRHFQRDNYGVAGAGAWKSLLVRFRYWEAASGMAKEYPLHGVGGGQFGQRYPAFKSANSEEVQLAHGNLAHLLAETGLLGAIVFLVFLAVLLAALYKKQTPAEDYHDTRDSKLFMTGALLCSLWLPFLALNHFEMTVGDPMPGDTALQYLFMAGATFVFVFYCLLQTKNVETTRRDDLYYQGLVASVAAFFVHGLVEHGLAVPALQQTACALMACALALRAPGKRSEWNLGTGMAAAPLLALGAILIFFAHWLLPMAIDTETRIENAQANMNEAAVLGKGAHRAMAAMLEEGEHINPFDIKLTDLRTFFLQVEYDEKRKELADPLDPNPALERLDSTFRRCLSLAPANSHYAFQLGVLYELRAMELLDFAENFAAADRQRYRSAAEGVLNNQAVPAYQSAIQLYPVHPEYHYRLGECYGVLGRNEAMAREFQLALDLSEQQWLTRLKLDDALVDDLKRRIKNAGE